MQELFSRITISHNETGIPMISAGDSTLQAVIAAAFLIIGIISVLFIIIGGYRYVISGGDQGAIKQAKNTILYAVVGLVITIVSFVVVQFVIGIF